MPDRYLPSSAMTAAHRTRLDYLLRKAGTPCIRMLADIKANAVVEVGIDWDDDPDIATRIERTAAVIELLQELKKGNAC